jgi:2-polyprenyl-3-methyl-5-hydroxy-6-metoxy-1,4-benzoquinol methylase
MPSATTACDLCGASSWVPLLESTRLDGPLVSCPECGLRYVGRREVGPAWAASSVEETVRIVEETIRRFPNLHRDEEERLNTLNARWRLDLIRRHRESGLLLEVGCGRGDFLKVAREVFEVRGIEPDPELARASASVAPVFAGTVEDSSWSNFDVAVSFHVIEHVDSPTVFLESLARRLRSGGLLVIETPDIGGWPYRLFGSHWRQFIPGHYYFFDQPTLARLLDKCGFDLVSLDRVGKYASPALVATRLGRRIPFVRPLARWVPSLAFRVNPGDIMLAIAVRRV